MISNLNTYKYGPELQVNPTCVKNSLTKDLTINYNSYKPHHPKPPHDDTDDDSDENDDHHHTRPSDHDDDSDDFAEHL
jgi:hypothetical protein